MLLGTVEILSQGLLLLRVFGLRCRTKSRQVHGTQLRLFIIVPVGRQRWSLYYSGVRLYGC